MTQSSNHRRVIDGIHLIRVQGDTAERARAHAALLKKEIHSGVMPVVYRKNEWLIRRGPGLLQVPWVQNLAVGFYRKILFRYLKARLPEDIQRSLHAYAEEAGIPYDSITESLLQPDAMMVLARTSMMRFLLSEWVPGALPGCTSAVVSAELTQGQKLLACRNLDYPLIGAWEKDTTVVFNEPSEAGEIPYVFLTSAGVHTGGLTSMNREGLTLFLHAHFGRDVNLRGQSIIVIGDEIIRKAKTIGQAVDLARKIPSYANWAFVVASAKENDAVVIEKTPYRVMVHPAKDGFLAHTNYFHSPELRKKEALLSGAYCEDLKARICRIREILQPHFGKVLPEHMASALGDHVDPFTGEERVFGNTVGVMTTVKSAVFEPENQRFWISSRKESPCGLGDYVEINWDRFWRESPEAYQRSVSNLPGYQPKDPKLLQGIEHYREAYYTVHVNNHDDDYLQRALASVVKAVAAYPRDGHLWVQAGILAFKLGEFEKAQSYFEGCKNHQLSSHVGQVRDLLHARALDQLGLRDEAVRLYQKHAHSDLEPKIKRAFRSGLRKPYSARRLSQMVVDLQFPDTFEY